MNYSQLKGYYEVLIINIEEYELELTLYIKWSRYAAL